MSKAPLRGRRKFFADFGSMQAAIAEGCTMNGLQVSNLQPGDDEGSFQCEILRAFGQHLLSLHFLISDTSEYPSEHKFFCYSQDQEIAQNVKGTLESLHEEDSLGISDLFSWLLKKLSQLYDGNEEEPDEDDYEDYGIFDDELLPAGVEAGLNNKSLLSVAALQRDFNEVVLFGYRPGLIRLSSENVVFSVSIPVVNLARDIPPRALMAWDRRLLAQRQHLTLLISGFGGVYPALQGDGALHPGSGAHGISLQFKVGLTSSYKPLKNHVINTIRVFGLQTDLDDTELSSDDGMVVDLDSDQEEKSDSEDVPAPEPVPVAEPQESTFQPFSLSASLETLLDYHFLSVIQLRIKYGIGWAGAEVLAWEAERMQMKPEDVIQQLRNQIAKADSTEAELSRSYNLPPDPLLSRDDPIGHLNLPLLAYCYLIRRLTLCPRYCIVCHNKLQTDFETLKPYVCDSKLCNYQYYHFNRGPSLEYEICNNTETVDLLVSLAYVAAASKVLDEPLPIGIGLRVPSPHFIPVVDQDGLCEFDTLDRSSMCAVVVKLIDALPPILKMKKHLEKIPTSGRTKRKLKDMDPTVPEAAWFILRWCVASCTAHLEELKNEEDRIRNIGPDWRQFRFTVGAPDAEAKFKTALTTVQEFDANSRSYPSIFAFHGSPVDNWHSIIRHGLWYKTVVHGRAYGNGVYFAKEGNVSLQSYSRQSSHQWSKSAIKVQQCAALAEIVNCPSNFVSSKPFLVVSQTEWIICRYLLVKSNTLGTAVDQQQQESSLKVDDQIPFVLLDPTHSPVLNNKPIRIPEPSYQLQTLITARLQEFEESEYDQEDLAIFDADACISVYSDYMMISTADAGMVENDWVHDPEWVKTAIEQLLPPPSESSMQATRALQRELETALKEQEKAKSLRDLGWYIPTDLIGDNLFQWIVELHSFEKDLPITQDMEARGVNSLVFEIRFPPSFPHAPPFFRILKPRFLPFIQGGGGHVTGGGSMCMDLLTADGWLPSYSISAILLQIKLAISNLDPRPARLAQEWNKSYSMQEALEGYKRAATAHGWKIPAGLDKLVRS